MAYFDAEKEGYELAEIDGRPVLFTNMRLDRRTIPRGLFCYDVRDSDRLDGSIAEIRLTVAVNHWGTILSKKPFLLDEYGSYYPKDWSYLGQDMSLAAFQAVSEEQLRTEQAPELTM